MNRPDSYEILYAVYTADEDLGVLKKYCEKFGYPNCTIDGEKMYENTHFKTEEEAWNYLRSETYYAVKQGWRRWKEVFKNFREINQVLFGYLWNYIKARSFSRVTEVNPFSKP